MACGILILALDLCDSDHEMTLCSPVSAAYEGDIDIDRLNPRTRTPAEDKTPLSALERGEQLLQLLLACPHLRKLSIAARLADDVFGLLAANMKPAERNLLAQLETLYLQIGLRSRDFLATRLERFLSGFPADCEFKVSVAGRMSARGNAELARLKQRWPEDVATVRNAAAHDRDTPVPPRPF